MGFSPTRRGDGRLTRQPRFRGLPQMYTTEEYLSRRSLLHARHGRDVRSMSKRGLPRHTKPHEFIAGPDNGKLRLITTPPASLKECEQVPARSLGSLSRSNGIPASGSHRVRSSPTLVVITDTRCAVVPQVSSESPTAGVCPQNLNQLLTLKAFSGESMTDRIASGDGDEARNP
jgi:hypothetical protein